MYYKNSQGRHPSNFLIHFLEIDDFKNWFWLNLTFSVLSQPLQLCNFMWSVSNLPSFGVNVTSECQKFQLFINPFRISIRRAKLFSTIAVLMLCKQHVRLTFCCHLDSYFWLCLQHRIVNYSLHIFHEKWKRILNFCKFFEQFLNCLLVLSLPLNKGKNKY